MLVERYGYPLDLMDLTVVAELPSLVGLSLDLDGDHLARSI